ncbi:MAG: hypothetical protein ACO1TE_14320 [Prosthecobacter sp.]
MTGPSSTHDKNLRIAITGSLVVHALLFLLLAWMFAGEAAHRLWKQATAPTTEKEVTLLFPDQIMKEPEIEAKPVPEPAKPQKKEVYIRTSQNETAAAAPKNAAFIADRNTTAATVKAPSPDATAPMPSMDGLKLPTQDMADRDHKNGELKDDAQAKAPTPKLAVRQPSPATAPAPFTIVKPKDAAPPPQPALPMPPSVAKAVPETTPLTRMMKEADKALALEEKNRLPIELKKAESATPTIDTPPSPSLKPQMPSMREVMETPTPAPDQRKEQSFPDPKAPKALPVVSAQGIERTTPNAAPDSFMPFTRVQQTKGTISNRGSAPAVDAEESPKGRYIRQVTGQVEKKWHLYRLLRRDGVTAASLEITFYVNKKGKVEDLRIVNDKESNPVLTGFTLQAIKDAEIPPMPAEVLPSLPMNDQERLKVEYNVLIY